MVPEKLLIENNLYKSLTDTVGGRKKGDIIEVTSISTETVKYKLYNGRVKRRAGNVGVKQEILFSEFSFDGGALSTEADIFNALKDVHGGIYDLLRGLELYADLSFKKDGDGMYPIGSYVVCVSHTKMHGEVHKVIKHNSYKHCLPKDVGGVWTSRALRFATEKEILSSQYAQEYKYITGQQATKPINKDGLQIKITTDGQPKTGVSVRLRSSTSKVTNGRRYTGNRTSIKHRKARIGRCQISPTSISAGGIRCSS